MHRLHGRPRARPWRHQDTSIADEVSGGGCGGRALHLRSSILVHNAFAMRGVVQALADSGNLDGYATLTSC